jgi:FKBP-type peptidyl-prolyl cis-trans isomerase
MSALPAEQLGREMSEISSNNQALSREMREFRADLEHTRDEEGRKFEELERAHEALQVATQNEHRKITSLESENRILQNERNADRKKILELDRRLSEIEDERIQLSGRVSALEDSHAGTEEGLQNATNKIRELQAGSDVLSRQFSASLQETSNQIKSTDSRLGQALERLGEERGEYQLFFKHTQARFLKQESRISWAMAATFFSLLLAATAAGLLVWEVQKNSRELSSINADIRALRSSLDSRADTLAESRVAREQPSKSEASPGGIDKDVDDVGGVVAPATPESGPDKASEATTSKVGGVVAPATPESGPDKAPEATTSKPDVNSLPAGDVSQDTPVEQPGEDKRTAVRMADAFFKANAERDGVVSLSSGFQYRIVTPGSGRLAQPGNKLIVRYAGLMLDGAIFAETYTTQQPVIVEIDRIAPQWREVLLKMREGVEFEVYLPPAHSATNVFEINGISPNEPVIYLVRLLQVVDFG